MANAKHRKLWILWILITVVASIALAITLFLGKDKSVFMPGEMTGGHHQIGVACDACHTETFGVKEDLQTACLDCHGDERKKPFDSHPSAKFKDPRNADLLEKINALQCVSCHSEHRPESTLADGVTQPIDFCVHCHSEVAEERPSHEGLGFETCASAGCHNYHDNRAIYTNFLIKHLDEPALLEKPKTAKREYGQILDQLADYPHDAYPQQSLSVADIDAPEELDGSPEQTALWASSAHAEQGVNCTACHSVGDVKTEADAWEHFPADASCSDCHAIEVADFGKGKHGMKRAVGLPAMTPGEARLPMHPEVFDHELSCNSCHDPHSADVRVAAVEACESCHSDEHTTSYRGSKHFETWQAEISGQADEGTGVSCATCHMPRESKDVSDWLSRVVVNHNNSATLAPVEKMLRPACLNCHGMEYSLSALDDEELVRNNFQGSPKLPYEPMKFTRDERDRITKKSGN